MSNYEIFDGPYDNKVAVNKNIDHKVIAFQEQNFNGKKCIDVITGEGMFTISGLPLGGAIQFFEECADRMKRIEVPND